MKSGQDLDDTTSGVLPGVKSFLTQWRPDAVLVRRLLADKSLFAPALSCRSAPPLAILP